MYNEISIPVRNKFGQVVFGSDGRPKTRPSKAKKPETNAYQAEVTWLCKTAKRPPGFQPKHIIIIGYRWYLTNDMDCDNMMKATNDAIAVALGLNDKRFLSVPFGKDIVHSNPRTEITIYDGDLWDIMVVPR